MKKLNLNRFLRVLMAVLFTAFSFVSCQNESTDFESSSSSSKSSTSEQKVGDFLNQQESLGGHTLERHVGKTTAYLQNRLNTSSISAASTYYDIARAEQAIQSGISASKTAITNWKSASATRYTANYTNATNVGVVLKRGASATVASRKIIIVLEKKSSAPNGYYVLTSYPN